MDLTSLAPVLNETATTIFFAVASVLATIVTAKVYQWTGIKIEIAKVERLHEGAVNAVNYIVQVVGKDALKNVAIPGSTNPLVRYGLEYMKTKFPDYIRQLGLSDQALIDIMITKIGPVLGETGGMDVAPVVSGSTSLTELAAIVAARLEGTQAVAAVTPAGVTPTTVKPSAPAAAPPVPSSDVRVNEYGSKEK